MNSVERVKAICKERKIPISRLERDLNFANGYIGQLRKGVFPDDRLAAIAEYLGVSVAFLLNGSEEKDLQKQTGVVSFPNLEIDNPDIMMIARAGRKMTSEQAETLRKMAEVMFPEAFRNDN